MTSKLRLIFTWDIRPGREQEYSLFVNDRLAPGLVEIGLPPKDVYYTAYGQAPQMMVVLTVPNKETLYKALASSRWQTLKQELMQYIENYQEKVVRDSENDVFF